MILYPHVSDDHWVIQNETGIRQLMMRFPDDLFVFVVLGRCGRGLGGVGVGSGVWCQMLNGFKWMEWVGGESVAGNDV